VPARAYGIHAVMGAVMLEHNRWLLSRRAERNRQTLSHRLRRGHPDQMRTIGAAAYMSMISRNICGGQLSERAETHCPSLKP